MDCSRGVSAGVMACNTLTKDVAPCHRLLIFEGVSELFNDWIGEHVLGNPPHFRFCFGTRKPAVQRQLKILALPNAFQPLVTHLFKSTLDRLALGIENALL